MKLIQNCILDYLGNEDHIEEKYQNLSKCIEEQKITENKHEFKSTLYLIHKISKNHYRLPNFFDKISQILSNLQNNIKKNFTNNEIFDIFKTNKMVLLILIQEKILQIDESIVSIMINQKYQKRKYPEYFYPEIKDFIHDQKMLENIAQSDTIENFEEKRKIGENESEHLKMIQKDLIEEFIIYVNREIPNINERLSPSIFETNSFLLKRKPTLMEYASFYGSIQIFKYLIYNNGIQTKSLWEYAIHGYNPEIIQILEEKKVGLEDNSYSNCIEEAIKCHHNDMANYILDKSNDKNKSRLEFYFYDTRKVYDNDVYKNGLRYYNFEYFPKSFINNFIFCCFCHYDYFIPVEFLLKTKRLNINCTFKISINKLFFLYNFKLNNHYL